MSRPRSPAALLVALVLALPTSASAGEQTTFTLELDCSNPSADVGSMEHTYLEQGCWGHVGIHHYFVGGDGAYTLHGGAGRLFSVEQQLSPPVEFAAPRTSPPQVVSSMPVEVSLDGITWTRVADAGYRFAGLESGGTATRQEILFTFTAAGEPFRFIRVRQPLSAAQGLSGYLDASRMTLEVGDAGLVPAPVVTRQENAARNCSEHIMEAVWAAHPCWFGGINRWDTPSFFHTYPLGDARLDRVEATVVFAYFRPEDPGTCCGQTRSGILDGPVLLQSSLDGEAWQTIATVEVGYGTPHTFAVDGLDGRESRFLRLVADKHPGYWNHPALKHPEAYLLHSELILTGLLP